MLMVLIWGVLILPEAFAGPKAVGRDGPYTLFDNGIVADQKTRLEWVVGPDTSTNWYEAEAWVKNLSLSGGGWRMPTKNELHTLFQKDKGPRHMTPLLKTTGWWVWSGSVRDDNTAWGFHYSSGKEYWGYRPDARNGYRVFAVRFQN